MIKTIRCPNCNIMTTIEGNSGEIKSVTCSNCGIKGNFRFPIDAEPPNIIKQKTTRPLGITILAILQIIGTIISIIVLIIYPMFLSDYINEFFGIPIFQFLIINILIMIPISLFLAYGLIKGKEWARFTSVLFQLSSVITTIIRLNILGVIIPIYIIYYLHKPHVKDFFRTEKGFRKDIKMLIIGGIIILLIFNIYTALFINPYYVYNRLQNFPISTREEQLIGTWHNTNGDITLQFNSDYTCIATKDGETYEGTWKINEIFYHVDLIWEIPFQLEHPNKAGYNYTIEQIFFIGQTISLYLMFGSPSYYICNKE